jgi:hydrogenase/urease accessory protein HupE
MTPRVVLAAVAASNFAATPAMAHPPPLGLSGFSGGLLHPLFVPAHAMALLGLGLLIGRQQAWGRVAILSAVIGLAAGLGVMTLGVVPVWMNEIVLGCALLGGASVALNRPLPEVVGCVFAVLIGFCIALDSPPEAISLSEANRMLLGTGLGAVALLVIAATAVGRLKTNWAQIAVRILGSWIAASALLVLALRFVR